MMKWKLGFRALQCFHLRLPYNGSLVTADACVPLFKTSIRYPVISLRSACNKLRPEKCIAYWCVSLFQHRVPERFSFSLQCSWITRWLLIWHWSPWWTKQHCCKVLSWFSVPRSPLLSWCLVQSSSIWRGFSSVSLALALADGHRNTIHLPGIPASACLMHTTTRMTHCCVWGCWM